MAALAQPYATFETVIDVRPDTIDMNNHVHHSRYLDYVLAARYDQMRRCYKMAMEEFAEQGLGWVVKGCRIEYKRPLRLGDPVVVRTRIAADGEFEYALVRFSTGGAEEFPSAVVERYSVRE